MINWIPITERLPEWDRYDIGKSVAVTIEVVEVDKPNRVCDIVEFYAATPDCHAVFCDEYGEIEGVIAWAEVEPYMGGGEAVTTKQYRATSIAIEDAIRATVIKACKKRRLNGEDAFICASSAAINLAAGIVVDRMGFRDTEKANQAADAMAMQIAETIGSMIEGMAEEVKP